ITNYYHWCVDSLCRIYLSTRFLPDTYTLLLPEGVPSYITDSLSFFGITRVRLIPRKAVLQLPELFLMNYAAGSGRHHPRILSEVRNKIRSGLAARSAKPFRKIYVSRSRQQSRKIANETEVKQMLEQHGFETVYFEGMSINQQIERMQECSVFVSSHGANMTNTLFLPAGAQVLELINDREPNFCYWSLCSCIGIAYFYQLSPLSGSNHIRVDLETLETNLERMQTHS
ncbi:MAG TPA: glycosyltransferase family 61 protein, partial [Bacteroidia bacterium]|nr:glycosyltransferase family 61 protein [Bacteroidia bacterium]